MRVDFRAVDGIARCVPRRLFSRYYFRNMLLDIAVSIVDGFVVFMALMGSVEARCAVCPKDFETYIYLGLTCLFSKKKTEANLILNTHTK